MAIITRQWIAQLRNTDGTLGTGLTVNIDIFDVITGLSVIAGPQAMTEVGNGFYRYPHTTFDTTLVYAANVDPGASFPSFMRFLPAIVIAEAAEEVTDQVWDEARAGHVAGGSTGEALVETLADTDSLDTTKITTARANNLDNLDATVSSRDTTVLADARAVVLIAEHDATQVLVGALNNLSALQVENAVLDGDIVAGHGTADTLGLIIRALGALISQRANNANLHALLGVVDAAGVDLPEQVDTELVTVQGHGVGAWDAVSSPTGVAAAVWDADKVDHLIPGSMGDCQNNLDEKVSTLSRAGVVGVNLVDPETVAVDVVDQAAVGVNIVEC